MNQKRWKPCHKTMNDSFDLRVRMGLYNRGPRRKMLDGLGVRWDDGINLLWPSPIAGEWDAKEAKRVAEVLRPDVEKYDTVLLFGAKVCKAFDVKHVWFVLQGIYVPMPHPSGRNRAWNDEVLREKVRRFFADEVSKV